MSSTTIGARRVVAVIHGVRGAAAASSGAAEIKAIVAAFKVDLEQCVQASERLASVLDH